MTIVNGKVSYAHFLYAAAHGVPVQDVLDDDVSEVEALMKPIEDFIREFADPTLDDINNIHNGAFTKKMGAIAKLPTELKSALFDWYDDEDRGPFL